MLNKKVLFRIASYFEILLYITKPARLLIMGFLFEIQGFYDDRLGVVDYIRA
jgi:hypothetical protein